MEAVGLLQPLKIFSAPKSNKEFVNVTFTFLRAEVDLLSLHTGRQYSVAIYPPALDLSLATGKPGTVKKKDAQGKLPFDREVHSEVSAAGDLKRYADTQIKFKDPLITGHILIGRGPSGKYYAGHVVSYRTAKGKDGTLFNRDVLPNIKMQKGFKTWFDAVDFALTAAADFLVNEIPQQMRDTKRIRAALETIGVLKVANHEERTAKPADKKKTPDKKQTTEAKKPTAKAKRRGMIKR